ncbi:MAG: hypothetical protein KA436_11905 [Oligoflexales bacterium]|nr:hypothetical protein [Oligoflexales bacterium]
MNVQEKLLEGKEGWENVRAKIRIKWDKITNDEIESLQENMGELVSILEKKYGYAKDHAEDEYRRFKSSLSTVANEVGHNKVFGSLMFITIGTTILLASVLTAICMRKQQKCK